MKSKMLRSVIMFSLLAVNVAFSQESTTKQQQPKHTPAEIAQHQTDWMKQNLNLTDDQLAKVQPINLAFAEKVSALHQSDADKGGKQQQMKNLLDQKDSELKGVLTDEQFQSLLQHRQEMKNKMKEHNRDQVK